MTVPDLWPRFTREARIDPERVRDWAPHDEYAVALRAGLLNHMDDDATFHSSEAFRAWRRVLVPAAEELIARRSLASFLAHIAIELCLDRLLLVDDPELGTRYYAELEAVDPGTLEASLIDCLGPCASGFGRVYDGFVSRRHLLDYTDPARVARSIEGVFELLDRGAPPSRAQLRRFVQRVEDALRAGPTPATDLAAWMG